MMKKYILICFCLGCIVTPALAQHQDSIIAKAREEADVLDAIIRKRSDNDSAYQFQYNAFRYSMQKRYRPEGEKFVKESFFHNSFIGLFGGYNQIIHRTGIDLTGGTEVGLSLTKFFTPSVGMRLSGSYTSANRKIDNALWTSYAITADHLFNLSAAVAGYNPNRMLEVLTVGGLGYHFSSLTGKKTTSVDLHAGMQLKLNTGTRWEMFAEPQLSLYSKGIGFSKYENWHRYEVELSAMLGVSYRLDNYYKLESSESGKKSFMDDTFVSAGIGLHGQCSELGGQQGLKPIYHVALGKWLSDFLGFRLSAFDSHSSWVRRDGRDPSYLTAYTGGRAEIMMNMVALFRKDIQNIRWGVIPMVGVEKGLMKKEEIYGLTTRGYTGWTAGLQLKYNVSDNFAFYVEPRVSRFPYSFAENATSDKVRLHSFSDNLFNTSFGVEFRRSQPERRALVAVRDGFVPYFYAQVGAGMSIPLQIYRDLSRYPGVMLTTAVGRQFTPLSGLRLGFDFNNAFTIGGYGDRYSFTSVSLNYMFDVSNLIAGYNPERKFGAEISAGPVFTRGADPVRSYVSRNIGVEGGVRAYYNLSSQFDIYAEPKVRMYRQRYMPWVDGNAAPLQISLAMGTSYRFGSSYNNSLVTNFGDGTFLGNTFVSTSIGTQSLIVPHMNLNPRTAAGPVFNLSVGKWLLPFFGLRVSAFGGYSSWGRVDLGQNSLSDRLVSQFGGRIEGMINVLAIGNQDWKSGRFGITPLFGLEFGRVNRQAGTAYTNSAKAGYLAVTAALQAKYYITNNIGLFVEPRMSRLPYLYSTASGNLPGSRASAVDNVVSFNVGFEFRRSSKSKKDRLASFKGEFAPYNFASFHIGTMMPMYQARYLSRKSGLLVGGTVGRQFLPISALRVGVDYSLISGNGVGADSHSFTNFSLDYMFDISNYMGGYDPERKFGLEILAGPVLSLGSEPNKVGLGAEVGVHLSYKLPKGFDVYLEPKVRMYSKSMIYGPGITPLQMMLSVGTSYKF